MQYVQNIVSSRNDPESLENLYQTARRVNEVSEFKTSLQTCYQNAPENVLYSAWHLRLQQAEEQFDTRKVNWKLAIPLSIILSLIFWVLALEDLDLTFVDQQPYLVQIWALIAGGMIIAFLTFTTRKDTKRAVAIVIGFLLFGVYAMFFSLMPNDINYQILASIHLIALAWIGVGFFILGRKADHQNRFAFLVKSIEVFVIGGIYAIGGAIFVAITYGLYETIDVRIPPEIERLIFPGGAGLIILLATASTYDPLQQPVAQNFRQGLSKLISTLMRLLMPLTLLVLVVFSFFILQPDNFWIPFNDRDALIIYNAMLFAVVFLLVGALPVFSTDLPPKMQTALRRGIIAVATLTVLVSLYAMSATLYRTYLGTLTMNRMTVIGWNTINIAILILLVYKLLKPGRAGWVQAGQAAFSLGMIVYIIWTIFVILSVPLIFGGGWATGWQKLDRSVEPSDEPPGSTAILEPATISPPRAAAIPTATPASLAALPPQCPPDCAEANLAGAYLHEIDLRGANLTNANLRGADLSEADLRDANLTGADLTGADLQAARLEGASLHRSNMDRTTRIALKWRTVWQILNQSAKGRNLAEEERGGIDLSQADLRGADLRGANLAFTSLREADLSGTDLTGANLSHVNFYRTTLDHSTKLDDKWRLIWDIVNHGGNGVDLRGVNLSQANLAKADLSYANLSRAVLTNTNLSQATLYGADLRGAILTEPDPQGGKPHQANLNLADLAGVKLDDTTQIEEKWRLVWEIVNQGGRNRDLSGADLREADLHEIDLGGVMLVGARLQGANLKDANLSGADLKGAFLQNADLTGANLSGANLFEAYLTNTQLPADLVGVNLRKADLQGVDLSGFNLSGLNLSRADLRGVNLAETDLSQTDLSEAHLEGAYLWQANLSGANMRGTYLRNAYLRSADLSGADLTGAELYQTIMPNGEVHE